MVFFDGACISVGVEVYHTVFGRHYAQITDSFRFCKICSFAYFSPFSKSTIKFTVSFDNFVCSFSEYPIFII